MGSSASPAELAGKLSQAASALDDSTREGVREAAIVGKAIMIAGLPTRRMANVGRSGARLGARFDGPKGDPPYAVLSYNGPVHLLHSGARPHMIGPKGWRRGRGSTGALKFTGGDGGIRRGVVMHPGTKGSRRDFFGETVARVREAAPEQMKAAARRSLMSVFG